MWRDGCKEECIASGYDVSRRIFGGWDTHQVTQFVVWWCFLMNRWVLLMAREKRNERPRR